MYAERAAILDAGSVSDIVRPIIEQTIEAGVHEYTPVEFVPEEWSIGALAEWANQTLAI
jgi:preprotein translocase subunit SecA